MQGGNVAALGNLLPPSQPLRVETSNGIVKHALVASGGALRLSGIRLGVQRAWDAGRLMRAARALYLAGRLERAADVLSLHPDGDRPWFEAI
jgi:hypothetical protein